MNKNIKHLVFAALFAALIAVFTAFVKFPFGPGGYVHLGDILIYLAASMLPLPYAMGAAAVGGMFADIIAGAPLWAPATFIIKALLVIAFTCKKDKIICGRNIGAAGLGIVITVVGYYFAEVILLTLNGDYASYSVALGSALLSAPWNILQSVASGILFIIIGFALDKAKIKQNLIER